MPYQADVSCVYFVPFTRLGWFELPPAEQATHPCADTVPHNKVLAPDQDALVRIFKSANQNLINFGLEKSLES